MNFTRNAIMLLGALTTANLCSFLAVKIYVTRSDGMQEVLLKADSSRNNDDCWERNFIKGGEWPELFLNKTIPIYGAYSMARRNRACEECLGKVQRFDKNESVVTYVCAAKAGSRTVRDNLCGCCSGLQNNTPFMKSCMQHQQHHCHRCSIRHLELHGAKKIIVPVREPMERLLSLVKFQWKDYAKKRMREDIVSPEKFFELYKDPNSHDEIIQYLSMAWQSYEYYFYNSTGNTDLQIVCVNSHMLAQYNYGIKRLAEAPEKMLHAVVLDGVTSGNQYEGNRTPDYWHGNNRRLQEVINSERKIVFPEISFEQELWNTYCV